jgi:hypothetical protein
MTIIEIMQARLKSKKVIRIADVRTRGFAVSGPCPSGTSILISMSSSSAEDWNEPNHY